GSDMVVADNVTTVNATPGVDVTLSDTQLVFTAEAASRAALDHVQAGSIIASGQGDGFLRRVMSVTRTADSVVLDTEAPALPDAIKEGRLSGTVSFGAHAAGSSNVRAVLRKSSEDWFLEVGNVKMLGDADIDFDVDDVHFGLDGDLTVNAVFGWGGLEE